MVLHTMLSHHYDDVVARLERNGIAYLIRFLTSDRFNVFFGDAHCIAAIEHFVHKPLYELTDEEDFILGILLGYDVLVQCKRYNGRKDLSSITVREN